ncbi:putative Ig domain-containing protein, partial [Janthinobacterium sp. EB271-G4-3-1]|nr:putative Ig domain-containing protein [Janthinobacterium sp. EB271-G4-3-1]
MFLNFTKFGWLSTPVSGVDCLVAGDPGTPAVQTLARSWLTRLAGTLLFVLLSLWSHQASAASTCPSPRAVSIVAGGEYYEDYTNAPCSQFGLTGTLVAPLYGTLEDSNATNAVRYRNTNLSATSDTFTVRDDVGQPIVYNVTITSAIVLAPATVPNATVAQPYSTTTLTATGGAAPYTYAVSAGALPAGVSLSGGGVLSGTPTAGGTFNFTVRATDSLAVNGTRAYTLTVAAPTIAIAPTTLPAMTAGLAYSQGITAANGTASYT